MSRRKSRKIYAVDCETDPFEYGQKVAPFVWGSFDGESFYYFWGDTEEECCADFVEHLREEAEENPDEKILVYAHNGGRFDFMFLYKYFDADIMINDNKRLDCAGLSIRRGSRIEGLLFDYTCAALAV